LPEDATRFEALRASMVEQVAPMRRRRPRCPSRATWWRRRRRAAPRRQGFRPAQWSRHGERPGRDSALRAM